MRLFVEHVAQTYTRDKGTLGAIVSLEHLRKVKTYLQIAAAEGASFELGALQNEQTSGGYWMNPVILTGTNQRSRVVQEEIFGPVVTVMPFEDERDAISLANDSLEGLAAILLTRDGRRIRRIAERLEAGLVWVNCWLVRELGTPFGGMKNSGIGREGGAYSRDVFTTIRTIHIAD